MLRSDRSRSNNTETAKEPAGGDATKDECTWALPPCPPYLGQVSVIKESMTAAEKEPLLKKDVGILVQYWHPSKSNALGQFWYMLKSVELMEARNDIVKENMDGLKSELKHDMDGLKSELKNDIKELKDEINKINEKLEKIDKVLEKILAKI